MTKISSPALRIVEPLDYTTVAVLTLICGRPSNSDATCKCLHVDVKTVLIVERLTPSKNLSNLVLFRGEIFYLRPHKIGVYEVSKNSTYCLCNSFN